MLFEVTSNDKAKRSARLEEARKFYTNILGEVKQQKASSSEVAIIDKFLSLDIPRAHHGDPVLQHAKVQDIMKRVLRSYLIHHKIGYLSGMHEIVAIFTAAYLAPYIGCDDFEFKKEHIPALEKLTKKNITALETDIYFSLGKFLYYHDFGTITKQNESVVSKLEEKIKARNYDLYEIMKKKEFNVWLIFFSHIICCFGLDFPLRSTIRFMDYFIANFETLLDDILDMCSVICNHYSKELIALSFEEIMVYFSKKPWANYNLEEVNEMVQSIATSSQSKNA